MHNKKTEELLKKVDSNKQKISPKSLNYLKKLINLETSVLNNTLNQEELKKVIGLEGFTEIADYNFCNRPLKLIEENLFNQKNSSFKNISIISSQEYCGRIPMNRYSINFNEENIDLFEIYHYEDNCCGQKYLINLHKIISDSNNLTKNEKLKLNLTNYIYKLLLKDFGLKDVEDINGKQGILSRYSINTSVYYKEERSKVKTK